MMPEICCWRTAVWNVVGVIATRVLATGGTVLALEASELPGAPVTAVLRWTV
jgi:hypothetical protein